MCTQNDIYITCTAWHLPRHTPHRRRKRALYTTSFRHACHAMVFPPRWCTALYAACARLRTVCGATPIVPQTALHTEPHVAMYSNTVPRSSADYTGQWHHEPRAGTYPAACGKSRRRASPAPQVAAVRIIVVMMMLMRMLLVMMTTMTMTTTTTTTMRRRRLIWRWASFGTGYNLPT